MSQTILVVDDEPDNRVIFGTMLRHVGFSVVEAASGAEGLRKAEAEPPDLILLDISMPGMDGWEVMRRLQARMELAGIGVIALTAHGLGPEEWEGAGFCAYLQKPLDPRLLAEAVQGCLSLREVTCVAADAPT